MNIDDATLNEATKAIKEELNTPKANENKGVKNTIPRKKP
jgi:hypothetical protein